MKKILSALCPLAFSHSYAQRSTLNALLGLGMSLLAPAIFAQTWQTVDDFQYLPGDYAQSSGLAVTPNGTLFASGTGLDASDGYGLVFASTDAGSTWFGPLDNYNYGPGFETDYDGGMV